MKLLLRFLKPYKGLIAATTLALLLDVAGALFIPTILAEMPARLPWRAAGCAPNCARTSAATSVTPSTTPR